MRDQDYSEPIFQPKAECMLKTSNRMGSDLYFNSPLSYMIYDKLIQGTNREMNKVCFIGIVECHTTMKMYELQLDLVMCINYTDIVNRQKNM